MLSTSLLLLGHSNLIWPKPRNAIDSLLPEWSDGKAPYASWWEDGRNPCECINGTEACDIAQTCLWFSVGCGIGCDECDGGAANPNANDRCHNGMKPTVNNPLHRTYNRGAKAGSAEDWTKHNPWRAPGTAPVYDACGMAGGAPHPTPGHGEYTDTKYAKLGDRGSVALPPLDSGVVWRAGDIVETAWSIRANHGGGWQYRLCPRGENLTEACFSKTPLPFAGNSDLLLANGTRFEIKSTFVTDGVMPLGSTWQMNPLPNTRDFPGGKFGNSSTYGYVFPPPCHETAPPMPLGHGICSGEWITNITVYDKLRVPKGLKAVEYVLGYRMDCESSAQVWSSCADVTIVDY